MTWLFHILICISGHILGHDPGRGLGEAGGGHILGQDPVVGVGAMIGTGVQATQGADPEVAAKVPEEVHHLDDKEPPLIG